jgi:hypothetical protein
LIGKEARKYQIWTIAGYLLMANPDYLKLVSFDEDLATLACVI